MGRRLLSLLLFVAGYCALASLGPLVAAVPALAVFVPATLLLTRWRKPARPGRRGGRLEGGSFGAGRAATALLLGTSIGTHQGWLESLLQATANGGSGPACTLACRGGA
jgi:hypothetical protein